MSYAVKASGNATLNYGTYDAVYAVSAENGQTIQGAYTVDAAVKYGTQYEADGKTREGMATVESLSSMGDAALSYTVYPVTVNSAAAVYAIDKDGTGILVPSTGDKAIAAIDAVVAKWDANHDVKDGKYDASNDKAVNGKTVKAKVKATVKAAE